MKTMSVSEVKADWYQLLKAAAAGERIPVTRRGVAVVQLVPFDDPTDAENVIIEEPSAASDKDA